MEEYSTFCSDLTADWLIALVALISYSCSARGRETFLTAIESVAISRNPMWIHLISFLVLIPVASLSIINFADKPFRSDILMRRGR
jgi:hypothetical protein